MHQILTCQGKRTEILMLRCDIITLAMLLYVYYVYISYLMFIKVIKVVMPLVLCSERMFANKAAFYLTVSEACNSCGKVSVNSVLRVCMFCIK